MAVRAAGTFQLRLIRISSTILWIRLSGWLSLMIVGAWSTSLSLWLNIFDWLSNQGQEQILLRDEIDHVRQYLFIQKQRYGEKLNYEILEDERLSDYQLPKLVLQPLVEKCDLPWH